MVRFDDKHLAQVDKTYVKVFDYSTKYGGTYDSFKFYNDYYVEIASC